MASDPRFEEAVARGISNGLNKAAKRILERSSDIIAQEDIEFEGTLKGSGDVEISQPDKKWVYYMAKHAPFAHNGTGPRSGPPPLKPLLRWVRLKVGLRGEAAMRMAKALRWQIKNHGTPATKYLARARDLSKKDTERFLKREVEKELQRQGLRRSK